MRIRDGKNLGPGSGMKKSRIRDKHPGSATLSMSMPGTCWNCFKLLCACATHSYLPTLLYLSPLFSKERKIKIIIIIIIITWTSCWVWARRGPGRRPRQARPPAAAGRTGWAENSCCWTSAHACTPEPPPAHSTSINIWNSSSLSFFPEQSPGTI